MKLAISAGIRPANLLDLLTGPSPFRADRSRWVTVPLRLIGPGSVPLGALVALVSYLQADQGIHITLNARPEMIAVGLLIGASVVIARSAPTIAFLSAGGIFGWAFLSDIAYYYESFAFVVFPIPIVVTGVGFARKYGNLFAATVGVAVPVLIIGFAYISQPNQGTFKLGWALAMMFAVAANAVLMWRKYSAQGAQLAEVRRDAEGERGQRLFLEERSRIGREMHDVVAHHMSMVAVKASTAEYRLDDLSENTREEFRAIADTARESLTEMRRILAVFRTDEHPELAPQPGIERIDDLCQSARESGLEIAADVAEDLPELPDAVSLTAYRIVQEALSNIVRHAPGASATVELYAEGDRLAIVVMNSAPTRTPMPDRSPPDSTANDDSAIHTTVLLSTGELVHGAGRSDTQPMDTLASLTPGTEQADGLGLAGMRERVELLHGELFAQPLGRSGFLVKARLPMELVEEA